MADLIVIDVPVLAEIATLNKRYHWSTEMKLKKTWRETAYWAGIGTGRSPAKRRLDGKWEVHVSYPVRSLNQRRDPHNWIRTTKWIIDGLTDAGLWPDDDSRHVAVVDASFHSATINPAVTVTLTPIAVRPVEPTTQSTAE